MADESWRRYVFVAIDRATRWVFVLIKTHKIAAAARSFLNAVARRSLLTDNDKEFTDRLFSKCKRDATDQHESDALCQALGIARRLARPRTPQTKGMVERFNGAEDLE